MNRIPERSLERKLLVHCGTSVCDLRFFFWFESFRYSKIVSIFFVHLPEDDVLSVQPRSRHGANEELGSVRVLARVGHRQHARLVVDKLRLD